MPEFASVIELSALDGNNGFQINGEAAGDQAGRSVASAGDVNGDGFADLIIGAYGANALSGASYVVFGGTGGFPANLELSSLDGSNGFQISGEAGGDRSGFSVAAAGDINGDGFDDVIVGARTADPNGDDSGASYVVFGQAGGFAANLELSALDGSDGFQLSGEGVREGSGFSVAGAGDFNGDGIADLVVGAVGAGGGTGATYVVFGKTGGFAANLNLSDLDGSNGFQISGITANDRIGTSVASAGDVNGDGFDDLVIGAFAAEPAGFFSGASFVVFGRAGGFGADFNLSALDGSNGFRINGEAPFDFNGRSVASAGDINGDGFADLIIGAFGATGDSPSSGEAYVVFGRAGGFAAEIKPSALDGSTGFQISGETAGDSFGSSVAPAGDVNGDGFDDLIVGAFEADPNGNVSGASYVVFGKAGGFAAKLNVSALDGSNGFEIGGEAAGDTTGQSVAAAGDINGDGFDDLIVGADGADPNGAGSGSSYVIFGHRALTSVDRIGTGIAQAISGGFGDDLISAKGGNDRLRGFEGDDIMLGGDGDDTMGGGLGNDNLSGGNGNDRMHGSFGDNIANGGAGDDRIAALDGNDTLTGGEGNDTLIGGLGDDFVSGGAGDDLIRITGGNDSASGGAGIDTLSFIPFRTSGITADFATGTALVGAGIVTFSGIEVLEGTVRADTLSGGLGNDTIAGSRGGDVLSGGDGNDVFDFGQIFDSRVGPHFRDTISDFDAAEDLIDLSTIDAIAGGADDAFAFIGTAAFTDVGQVRVFQLGGNTFVDINATGDTTPDMRIELTGLVSLDAGDFVL